MYYIDIPVKEVQIGLLVVVLLPYLVSFYTITFLRNCDRGEGLRSVTSLKTVVGGRQRHANL